MWIDVIVQSWTNADSCPNYTVASDGGTISCTMNWKACARKWQWPNLRQNSQSEAESASTGNDACLPRSRRVHA
jgi:hypothetical protein